MEWKLTRSVTGEPEIVGRDNDYWLHRYLELVENFHHLMEIALERKISPLEAMAMINPNMERQGEGRYFERFPQVKNTGP